jgi:hypothetical protein
MVIFCYAQLAKVAETTNQSQPPYFLQFLQRFIPREDDCWIRDGF